MGIVSDDTAALRLLYFMASTNFKIEQKKMGKESTSVYGYTHEPFGCFIAFYDIDTISVNEMGFQYTYEEKAGYTLVVPEGKPTSVDELGEQALEMFRRAGRSDSKCVLIDRQDNKIELDKLDMVYVSDLLDKHDLQNLGVRVAVLSSPENVEVFTSLETSLTIRAFSYRVFADQDKAIAWLKGGC